MTSCYRSTKHDVRSEPHSAGFIASPASAAGGSGILAFILVLLLQGWYVLKIPSKLTNDSKKKEESRKNVRKKEKIGERKKSKKQIGED